MNSSFSWSKFWRGCAAFGLAFVLSLALIGCGGGGGGGSADSGGEVVIGLTDAEGDFLSYTVDVVSLELVKANGAVVETLPNKARIDFAQYTELTEFVTSRTVPLGAYTSAKMRLDYSSADIKVEDANGAAVSAIAKDANGQNLGVVEMTVRFDNNRHLVVARGVPAHLTLDFNLEASNKVDTTTTPVTVTVDPVLIAEVIPEQPKIHRVRGPLESVNTGNASYRIALRPLHLLHGDHGGFTVHTNANTVFEINGQKYDGGTGLAQLALLPQFSATLAIGSLSVPNHRFTAEEVYAGSSVPFGASDVVVGSVKARVGNSLTVIGASLLRQNGVVTFKEELTVNVSTSTKIVRQGLEVGAQAPTLADISVGSRVTAFGTLDASATSLDATGADDLVRILYSTVTGSVTVVAPNLLRVNLQTINGRRVSIYNFAGTGAVPLDDALPSDYEINTTGLALSGITTGTPVRVRGFVEPFGQAPEDFDAKTVINVAAVPAHLAVDWNPATVTPFVNAGPSALQLNLSGAPKLHHVFRAGVASDLTAAPYAPTAPAVQPQSGGRGLFAIAQTGTVQVYTDFGQYVSALQAGLNAGKQADFIGAFGSFDDATVVITAPRVAAVLR